jgi:Concanavalin A-like lectin/glucanases superfamily
MGVSGGPYVIRDSSLVLELDASDLNSYVSGSTTWNDLSGNRYNFTNYGATFSNNTFTFSSSSLQYMQGSISSNQMGLYSSSYTIESVCTSFSPSTENGAIFSFTNSSPLAYGTMGLIIRNNFGFLISNYGDDYYSFIPLIPSQSYNVTAVFSIINSTYTIYINGVFNSVNSNIRSLTSQSSNFAKIGKYDYGGSYHNGNISMIRLYNRALSAAEVLQNYNALKSRFGLT